MKLAPVVLFVYNRPEHTRLTIEALQNNILAPESDLYIYSDAAKSELQQESVEMVRKLIHKVDGFKSVKIIESHYNKGLAKSIVEGVTSLIRDFDRVVVLEDDLITSPLFLTYMNYALTTYEKNDQVMHVSGYSFPFDKKGLPETFFLRVTTCWGWGTWARAWRYFRKDISIINQFNNDMIHCFNFNGAYDYFSHLELNRKGKMNTWAIFWYANVFLKRGLCLHPTTSYVNNIGNDNSGVHSIKTDLYDANLALEPIGCFESNICENDIAKQRLIDFYKKSTPSLLVRLRNKINILISKTK